MVVAGMAEAVTLVAMVAPEVTLVAALISVADTLADTAAAISGTAVSGPMGSARAGSRPPTDMCGFATDHKALRAPPAGAFFVLESLMFQHYAMLSSSASTPAVG
jgi:hypothetical protein